jgi:hypothetical protein
VIFSEANDLPNGPEMGAALFLLGKASSLIDEDARAAALFDMAMPMLERGPRTECLRLLGAAALRLGDVTVCAAAAARRAGTIAAELAVATPVTAIPRRS